MWGNQGHRKVNMSKPTQSQKYNSHLLKSNLWLWHWLWAAFSCSNKAPWTKGSFLPSLHFLCLISSHHYLKHPLWRGCTHYRTHLLCWESAVMMDGGWNATAWNAKPPGVPRHSWIQTTSCSLLLDCPCFPWTWCRADQTPLHVLGNPSRSETDAKHQLPVLQVPWNVCRSYLHGVAASALV